MIYIKQKNTMFKERSNLWGSSITYSNLSERGT